MTYLKILEDPIQEPYTFIASMIENNLCRHLILNSVEHSADAVLFLINILPPLSKCTVVFGANRKRLWIKLSPYEIRLFFLFQAGFSKQNIKKYLPSTMKYIHSSV